MLAEAHSDCSQISKIELFVKLVKGWKPLTIECAFTI